MAVVQDVEEEASRLVLDESIGGDRNGFRVGYSIDTSIDPGNAAHYDVHDVSRVDSVLTEENPGTVTYWHFLLPNVHGVRQG